MIDVKCYLLKSIKNKALWKQNHLQICIRIYILNKKWLIQDKKNNPYGRLTLRKIIFPWLLFPFAVLWILFYCIIHETINRNGIAMFGTHVNLVKPMIFIRNYCTMSGPIRFFLTFPILPWLWYLLYGLSFNYSVLFAPEI